MYDTFARRKYETRPVDGRHGSLSNGTRGGSVGTKIGGKNGNGRNGVEERLEK